MKKILGSLIAILTLVVVGSYLYQANKKVEPLPVVATSTPEVVKPVVKKEDVILLYPESGDVTFKVLPTDDFIQATTSPTVIPDQAIVHTGFGKASVLLPDNSSISLDANTEITVNYGEKNTSIYQTLGTTYHRVQALISGKTYQVQTAGTLAAVRGTKFAVRYDVKTKKTKIAVTEHRVEVSTIPKVAGTSTAPAPEVVMVEEGKMVSVVEEVKSVGGKPTSPMQVTDTEKDTDMKAFVEEAKKVDIEVDTIKKASGTDEDFRKEMKKVMFEDEGVPKPISELQKKDDTSVVSADAKPIVPTPVPPTIIKKTVVVPVVKAVVAQTTGKMEEEAFFNAFEPLFIQYFYIDETDTTCNQKVTPQQRVDAVTAFAKKNGYPFTKPTLLSFAQAISAYCTNKDQATKLRLQSRFDDEYPFSDN